MRCEGATLILPAPLGWHASRRAKRERHAGGSATLRAVVGEAVVGEVICRAVVGVNRHVTGGGEQLG